MLPVALASAEESTKYARLMASLLVALPCVEEQRQLGALPELCEYASLSTWVALVMHPFLVVLVSFSNQSLPFHDHPRGLFS